MLIPKAPSSILHDENEVRSRSFSHFQQEVASSLAGVLDCPLWRGLILQVSHHEPFVRHVIAAMAAFDKSLQNAASTCPDTDPQDLSRLHREIAILEYSKALKAMRNVISEKSDLRNTVIACLLVFCFENLLGSRHSALSQAHKGHLFLQCWIKDKDPHSSLAISSLARYNIEDDLIHALGQLDLQISFRSDQRCVDQHIALKNDGSISIEHMPTKFMDMRQASIYWNLVMRRASHFICIAWKLSHSEALGKRFDG